MSSCIDRMDTVVKLVLIFFISLFLFTVGTFVGKGVIDSEVVEIEGIMDCGNGFADTEKGLAYLWEEKYTRGKYEKLSVEEGWLYVGKYYKYWPEYCLLNK